MSPSELKELYGLTVREICCAERIFAKQSYKKDKLLLHNHLEAITAEQKSKIREMELQKQRFIRDHKKILRHPQRKHAYKKIYSVEAMSGQDTPSRGSDATIGSFDEDLLLQELSRSLNAVPSPRAEGNASSQGENENHDVEVKELVDTWLDRINTTPRALSKENHSGLTGTSCVHASQIFTLRPNNIMNREPDRLTNAKADRESSAVISDNEVKASSSTPDETSSEQAPDDVTEYIQPVQEVMVHTDARGRQHQLTVRKVGLRCTSAREANVTIVHEDNVSNSQDAHNETDEEDQGSDQHDGDSNPQESPPSRQNTPRRDSCSQSRSNSIVEDEEAENLALWRRRLAHPHRFSWIPEFAEDKDAQALALAMLAQKRKVGEEADRFKAVHCRYLRMPKEYMAEELKELKWYDIFTS
nr:hypothetical protein BaRGS_026263 [Batillaria attramentaria]